jgi:hypothetical protein
MQEPPKNRAELVTRILAVVAGGIFASAAVMALCTGHVKQRSGDAYIAEDPSRFWAWVAFYVLVAVAAFWGAFKRRGRRG